MSILALLFLLPISPQTPRLVEGMLNGDFQRLEPAGVLGNTTTPADGGFWINAESRTLLDAGTQNRYLQIPKPVSPLKETLVYQRAGVATGLENLTTIDGKVRTAFNNREGRVSLVESDGEYYGMTWIFQPNAPANTTWSFLEESGGTYQNMTLGGNQYSGPAGSTIDVSFGSLGANADSMVIVWTPTRAGKVRVLVRPWRQPDQIAPGIQLTQELYKGTGTTPAGATLLRSDSMPVDDSTGREMVTSVELAANERVFLRCKRTSTGLGSTPRVFWRPWVAYQGKSLTYRFGKGLSSIADTADEKFVLLTLPTLNTWTTLASLNGGVALPAGATFQTKFGVAPKGPLELKLSVPNGSVGAADFDDLSCQTGFQSPSDENALRNAILAEARWARTNWNMTLDRGPVSTTPHTAPGQLGSKPTPYSVHPMKILSGPTQNTAAPAFGKISAGTWEILQRAYDETDYQDLSWIKEQELRNLYTTASPTPSPKPWSFCFTLYDCAADMRETTPGNNPEITAAAPRDCLDLYARTKDVMYLDRAYSYSDVIVRNGVVNCGGGVHPTRQDMILPGGFHFVDGSNPSVCDGSIPDSALLPNHIAMDAPLQIIRTYVACVLFNQAHPGISPARYPQSYFDSHWLPPLRTAMATLRAKKNLDSAGTWGGVFQAYHGQFNDLYGNVGPRALDAWKALQTLPSALAEPTLSNDLYSASATSATGIVDNGVMYFLPLWEQGTARHEIASGDQARAWPPYLYLVDAWRNTFTSTSLRMATQVGLAARNAIKFQYPGAVWTNGGLNPWQLLDTSGGYGGGLAATAGYGATLGFAMEFAGVGSAPRLDLMAALESFVERDQSWFKPTVPQSWSGRGYGYWVKANLADSAHDDPAGIEKRSLDAFLIASDRLQAGLPPPPAVAIVSPLSCSQAGTTPTSVSFTLHAPTHDASTALANRTRIDVWQLNATSGFWEPTNLWPSQPSLFTAAFVDATDTDAGFSLISTAAFAQPNLKITIRNYDAATNGQWDQDTLLLE